MAGRDSGSFTPGGFFRRPTPLYLWTRSTAGPRFRCLLQLARPPAGGRFTRVRLAQRPTSITPACGPYTPAWRSSSRAVHKFCMLAEGAWLRADDAPSNEIRQPGELILQEAGGETRSLSDGGELKYNEEDLHNPWFVCRSVLPGAVTPTCAPTPVRCRSCRGGAEGRPDVGQGRCRA